MDENFGQAYIDEYDDWRTRYENSRYEDEDMSQRITYFSNRLGALLSATYETGYLAGKTEALQGANRTPDFEEYQRQVLIDRNAQRDSLIAWVERNIHEA